MAEGVALLEFGELAWPGYPHWLDLQHEWMILCCNQILIRLRNMKLDERKVMSFETLFHNILKGMVGRCRFPYTPSVHNSSLLSCMYAGNCYVTRNSFNASGSLWLSDSWRGMLLVCLSIQATPISWPMHSGSCLGKLQVLSTIPFPQEGSCLSATLL